jgi:glucokinase
MRTFLGIEIGGTKLQLVVGDEHARIIERFRFDVDPELGADGIKTQIRAGLDRIQLNNVSAIAIGFGGPVDHHTGRVITSYQVSGWGDFVIGDWLKELTGLPVWIDNDANIAGYGEALFGAGKGFNQVFYVTLGSGVGAGFVVDNQIYHGGKISELEFGHIRLDKSGRTVESSCSGWAVDRKIRDHVKNNPNGLLAKLTHGYSRGEARVLSMALEQGDPSAVDILEMTADDLAFGLSHAVHLLNPQAVILGGGFSLIGEPLLKAVRERLPDYLMDVMQPGPEVRLSSLREDVVPIGALALAINKITSKA